MAENGKTSLFFSMGSAALSTSNRPCLAFSLYHFIGPNPYSYAVATDQYLMEDPELSVLISVSALICCLGVFADLAKSDLQF